MSIKIELENVSMTYRSRQARPPVILEGIDLKVQSGDFVIILGESGCGKSTLLNIMAGLIRPTTGSVKINGRPLVRTSPTVSILFQEPDLLPWLTVEENIAFGCRIRGDLKNLTYRVRKFIEMIGLSGFEKHHPAALSLGMAFRVCLARALIGQPDVFLLDEPFSALDTFNRSRLQEELINIWMSEGFTAVFVTHDISEALLLGKKIVLLGGRPCRIRDTIALDFPYPRRIADDAVFQMKKQLLRRFKKALI